MRFDPNEGIDARDWNLLHLLRQNARLSFAELGRRLRLSAPAVAERVRRLEERGIISAYRAELDLSKLGRGLHVYMQITVQPKDYARFKKVIETLDDVLECYHTTGRASFLLRAAVTGVPALQTLIEKLGAFGPTESSVVLSSALDRRKFIPG